jgi:insertion element IS1 protein InsB
VNPALVPSGEEAAPAVVIRKVEGVELDEMWSFVGRKQRPRWLWHAIDHRTGQVLGFKQN